jgi:hypothetical protein
MADEVSLVQTATERNASHRIACRPTIRLRFVSSSEDVADHVANRRAASRHCRRCPTNNILSLSPNSHLSASHDPGCARPTGPTRLLVATSATSRLFRPLRRVIRRRRVRRPDERRRHGSFPTPLRTWRGPNDVHDPVRRQALHHERRGVSTCHERVHPVWKCHLCLFPNHAVARARTEINRVAIPAAAVSADRSRFVSWHAAAGLAATTTTTTPRSWSYATSATTALTNSPRRRVAGCRIPPGGLLRPTVDLPRSSATAVRTTSPLTSSSVPHLPSFTSPTTPSNSRPLPPTSSRPRPQRGPKRTATRARPTTTHPIGTYRSAIPHPSHRVRLRRALPLGLAAARPGGSWDVGRSELEAAG